jgi:hypothetical protein
MPRPRNEPLRRAGAIAIFAAMSNVTAFPMPPRVPTVEPDLLSSAVFVFGEYLAELEAETPEGEEEEGVAIDTRAVLDRFAEELGTTVTTTLALYLRVTALYRLLAASPTLARLAMEDEELGGRLSEDALLAAARLDLQVTRNGGEGSADFDPRQFREALRSA